MKNKFLIISFLFLFITIQAWFMYVTFSYSVSGVVLEKNNSSDWVIKQFENPATGSKIGLQIGDVIRKVNGVEADEYSFIKRWRSLDQVQSLTVLRKSNEIEIINPKASLLTDYLSFYFIGEVLSFIMAALLYKTMNVQSARFLTLVFINVGFIFMSLGASGRGDVLGKIFVGAGVILLPVIFLHFMIVLLREKGGIRLPDKFLKYLYAFVMIIFIGEFTFFTETTVTYYIYRYTVLTIMLFFLIGILSNFIFLSYIYVKHRKEKSYISTMIKTIWISLFISFSPLIFLSFLPKLVYGYEWVNSFITSWSILFFPLSFAYLIGTKQLFDIGAVVRRIILTVLISIVPSGLIIAFIAVLIPSKDLTLQLWAIFILTVIVISFVLYSLEYFMTKLESLMFPRKHHLRTALKKIAKDLGTISSMRELKEIILADLVQTLQVYGAAIMFRYSGSDIESVGEGDIDLKDVERVLAQEVFDRKYLNYSVFPINRHEEYSSYLVLTRKKTNTFLSTEEEQWLHLIISYLSVSLENLYLIRRLTLKLNEMAAQIPNEQTAQELAWFRKFTFDLLEWERGRIERDLHDMGLKDLFFLKRRFESFLSDYPFSEEEKIEREQIIDLMDSITKNLRYSCFELNPHLLHELGFIGTLQEVIEEEQIGCPFEIEFISEGALAIEDSGMESKKHLFRIFQELLINAKKHSEASKVVFRLTRRRDYFYFNYEDDGVGIDANRTKRSEIGSSGMGMEHVKSRVIYLKGEMELQTAVGQGLQIQISLPKEGLTA